MNGITLKRLASAIVACLSIAQAQQSHVVIDARDAKAAPPTPLEGTLVSSGYGVTTRYFTKDGKPWLPVLGEFHYVRCPQRLWSDALDRIKLGGIDIVGTYVFWNHHEEDEGHFNWTGDRDLRKFLQLAKSKNMRVIVRLGPFSHGEARNGGLPDWLYGSGIQERSNDPRYLAYVERFYNEIGKQARGLLVKDGGPVVGVQIENEYQASGAPWEPNQSLTPEWAGGSFEGASHLIKLKALAIKAGFDVPFYSATAWDAAPIVPGFIPMHSCYPVNFWASTPEKVYDPSKDYMLVNRWKFPGFATAHRVSYDPDKYPYFMCEMGVGMTPTMAHRPWTPGDMPNALGRVLIGGGANTLGYYMYRGGTQFVGKYGYMNEGTLPRLNYDYQAPIGQYGDFNASFYSLRLIHTFLHSFGDRLAPMEPVAREGAEKADPADVSQVGYSVRSDGSRAFLFLSNFQTGASLKEFTGLTYTIRLSAGDVTVQDLHVDPKVTAMLPIHFDLGAVDLTYATAEPIHKMEVNGEDHFLFAAVPGMAARFAFRPSDVHTVDGASTRKDGDLLVVDVEPGRKSTFKVTTTKGKSVYVTCLDRGGAELTSVINFAGKERWVSAVQDVISGGDVLKVETRVIKQVPTSALSIYPDPGALVVNGKVQKGDHDGIFASYEIASPAEQHDTKFTEMRKGIYSIQLPEKPAEGTDQFLSISYLGDHADASIEGKMVADHFNLGENWNIRLNGLQNPPWGKEMVIRFHPLVAKTTPEIYVRRRRIERHLTAEGAFSLDGMDLQPLQVIELKPVESNSTK